MAKKLKLYSTAPSPRPEREKTTVTLPKDLKLKAKIHALRVHRDLGDLIEDGLRLVLNRDGAK